MKAVILAGGEGRRLKAVTGELPKPMAPLLGKPLMERIIELLRSAGIRDICAALAYNPRAVTDYFGDGSGLGVRLRYSLETEPLGTAGAVKACADFTDGEDFLVISGDAACDFDLRALIDAHRSRSPAATIALYRSSEPLRYGLALTDGRGLVRRFIEKPDWQRVVTDRVNTGIYVLTPRAMELVPGDGPFDFGRELFPLMLERGMDILGATLSGYWCDIGTPRSYYGCCLDALNGALRLPDAPPEVSAGAPARPLAPLPGTADAELRLPCRDRAGLMGALSGELLPLGADFSDGLTLPGRHCGVRISPCPDEAALLIRASSGDVEFSRELAGAAMQLAREAEQRV